MDLSPLRRPPAAWKKLTCAVTVLAVTLVAVYTAVPPAALGAQANGYSMRPAISDDGKTVVFESWANNLVPGDTASRDIFARLRNAETVRVSIASSGAQSNNHNALPEVSGGGRYVVFESSASNLVSGDTNGKTDVFLHDLTSRQTSRVSVSSSGDQLPLGAATPEISRDGRYVAFVTTSPATNADTDVLSDVYVWNRTTGEVTLASVEASGATSSSGAIAPAISGDGRYVAWHSPGTFAPGDSNGYEDVYVRDRSDGSTTAVSVNSGSAFGNGISTRPSISADGRYVAFQSTASNLAMSGGSTDTNGLADIYVRDRGTQTTTWASYASESGYNRGTAYKPAISGNGAVVVYEARNPLQSSDTNGVTDIYQANRTGTDPAWRSGRISTNDPVTTLANGPSYSADVSYNGTYAAMETDATNLFATDENGSTTDIVTHYWRSSLPQRVPGVESPPETETAPAVPGLCDVGGVCTTSGEVNTSDQQGSVTSTEPQPCLEGNASTSQPQQGEELTTSALGADESGRTSGYCLMVRNSEPTSRCAQYAPELIYDPEERFFARSASEAFIEPGNVLRRADGQEIARPSFYGGLLDLEYLDAFTYGDGQEARPDDTLHMEDAVLQGLEPWIYCREAKSQSGSAGCTWMQYWIWYYDNPAISGAGGRGAHKGDWEIVQFCPNDRAAYGQHGDAGTCPWDLVEKMPDGRPIVYVARSSHASYFRRGRYAPTPWPLAYDIAEGTGENRETPKVEGLGQYGAHLGWIYFSGNWGQTQSEDELFESTSPKGPLYHVQEWDEPDDWADDGGGQGC